MSEKNNVTENTVEETKETAVEEAAPKKKREKRRAKKEEVVVAEEKKYAAPTNFSLDLLLEPVVTEKTLKLQNELNTFVFKVAPHANKTSIMIAFEQIFNVKPKSVRVVNVLPKAKRVGRYEGKVSGYKKAYVTLNSEDAASIRDSAE